MQSPDFSKVNHPLVLKSPLRAGRRSPHCRKKGKKGVSVQILTYSSSLLLRRDSTQPRTQQAPQVDSNYTRSTAIIPERHKNFEQIEEEEWK
jgi:hypothetical protein